MSTTTSAALPTASEALSSMLAAISSMSAGISAMSEALETAAVYKRMDMSGMSGMSDMSGMSGMPTGTATSAAASTGSHTGMSSMSGMAGMATATATAATSTATSTGSSMGDMGGMSMGGDSCNVSMLWNWNTIDSCFLSNGWRITSAGKFAGTCIGVFLWVVFLVLLGSIRRRFDDHIATNAKRRYLRAHQGVDVPTEDLHSVSSVSKSQSSAFREAVGKNALFGGISKFAVRGDSLVLDSVRPNMLEQLVRALLFGFEYSITWLLGLILMSYNGYVIISAFIGAFIGFLLIEWNHVHPEKVQGDISSTPAAPTCC